MSMRGGFDRHCQSFWVVAFVVWMAFGQVSRVRTIWGWVMT